MGEEAGTARTTWVKNTAEKPRENTNKPRLPKTAEKLVKLRYSGLK